MTDHLFELPKTSWALWRWVCVRGAGFPAAIATRLAMPELCVAIDRLLELEPELDAARAHAIAVVERDLESRTDPEQRRAIAPSLRKLRAGATPEIATGLSTASAAAIDALRAVVVTRDELRARLLRVHDAERERVSRALREAARDPHYREALLWQNRGALRDGVDVLLRQPEGASNSKVRQHERLVTNHLQRYCLKNESIGFFGPVGWARLDATVPAIVAKPGPGLLAKRFVHFEHWGIDALASAITTDELRLHLAPRRRPVIWLDGTSLRHPVDQTSEIPVEYARVLAACDGERSAKAIAEQLVADPELGFSEPDDVYELIDAMVSQRLLIWDIELPPYGEHHDRQLAQILSTLADPDVAAPGLAKLAELQAARDRVVAAAGTTVELGAAMTELEQTFTRVTGADATRRPGETYAGRTLLYEDCRRDLELELGRAVTDRIAVPLSLLLASARWYTFEVARRYREALVAVHDELQRATGSASIDFLRFWERASEEFVGVTGVKSPRLREIDADLQARWASVLGIDAAALGRHRIDVASDRIAAAVAAEFAAPHPGWPSARHHSPDLMIAARGVDAITRGELAIVAGELHIACSTIAVPWTVRLHPQPEQIIAAMQHDRPMPTVEALPAKERTTRAARFSPMPGDFDVELGSARSRRPRDQALAAGALCVERVADTLRVTSRDGRHAFSFEEFFDSFLSTECLAFRLLAPGPHAPRVSIDGFVITRESWSFDVAALEFVRITDPIDRMIAVRRWARAHELPRHLFYKVAHERKPCFVDLESPHYVELMAHVVRKASTVAVSEMLPDADHVWLPDAGGARYTCELRICAVDPIAWQPR